MDIFGKHSDIMNINECREKPAIPELPKTIKDLSELLNGILKFFGKAVRLTSMGENIIPEE